MEVITAVMLMKFFSISGHTVHQLWLNIIQFMMSEDVKKLSQKPILSQTETWLWRTILLVERIYYLISRGKHEHEEEIITE